MHVPGPPRGHALVPRRRTRRVPLPRGRVHRAPLVRRPADRAGVPVRVRPRLHDVGRHHPGGRRRRSARGRSPRCGCASPTPAAARGRGVVQLYVGHPDAAVPRPAAGAARLREGARSTPARPAELTFALGMRDLARWDARRRRVGGRCRRAPRVGRHLVARPRRAGHRRAHRAVDGARVGSRRALSSVEPGAPDRATPLRRPGVRRRPDPARARDGPGAVGLPRRPLRARGGLPADRRPPPHLRAALVAVRPGAHRRPTASGRRGTPSTRSRATAPPRSWPSRSRRTRPCA